MHRIPRCMPILPGRHHTKLPMFAGRFQAGQFRPLFSWSDIKSAVNSVGNSIWGSNNTKTSAETRTTTDYAAMMEAGSRIISASSKATREDENVRIQQMKSDVEKQKLAEVTAERKAREAAVYSSQELQNRWVEDRSGFRYLKQGTFRRETVLRLSDQAAVDSLKKDVKNQMKDKGFDEADINSTHAALDSIARGTVLSDFVDLGKAEFDSPEIRLRAEGIYISQFRAPEIEKRPFRMGDRVTFLLDGKLQEGIVKIVRESEYTVEVVDLWHSVSSSSKLVHVLKDRMSSSSNLVDIPKENVFCAKTGESFLSEVVTPQLLAVSVSLGHLNGRLNAPVRISEYKTTETKGSDTKVTLEQRSEVLPINLQPDELLELGRVALSLPKCSADKPTLIVSPVEGEEKK